MDWTSYLPPTLQISIIWWVIGSCVAIRMMCSTIPDPYRKPWLMQLLALFFGVGIAIYLFPATVAKVYAVATGMMGAAFSIQFYDLVLSWVDSKVRSILGTPPTTTPTPESTSK